jgi:thioredoxin 1
MNIKLLISALAAVLFAGCGHSQTPQKATQAHEANKVVKEKSNMKVKEMTTAEFKQKVMNYDLHPDEWVFEGDKPVIVDFYATWCGPCKATAPNMEKVAEKYDGKVDVYKVDVDQEQELASAFGIQSIPSILFIPKEGKPQMQVGAMSYAQLDSAVTEVLL